MAQFSGYSYVYQIMSDQSIIYEMLAVVLHKQEQIKSYTCWLY